MVERRPGYPGDREAGVLTGVGGVATIVLNANCEMLVGTELVPRPSHERERGHISIPIETIKPFERNGGGGNARMIYAALSEIVTDSSIDKIRGNLRKVRGGLVASLNPDGLQCVTFVFHWTGDSTEMPFEPSSPNEFTDFRWMSLDDFANSSKARPYASRILQQIDNAGLLNGVPSFTIPEIEHYIPSLYLKFREMYPDVK